MWGRRPTSLRMLYLMFVYRLCAGASWRQLALSEDNLCVVEVSLLPLLPLLLQLFTQKTNLIIDSVNSSELLAVQYKDIPPDEFINITLRTVT